MQRDVSDVDCSLVISEPFVKHLDRRISEHTNKQTNLNLNFFLYAG